MLKVVVFWLLGVLTVAFVIGGGTWFAFWVFRQLKKNKII